MFFNVPLNVLTSGFAGYNLLQQSREEQEEVIKNNTQVQRETDYFKKNIGNVTSAEDFVEDSRLLRVALEAYGLGEEFSKKAYIQNILDSDLSDTTSAANRVSDPRWQNFGRAFLQTTPTLPKPLEEGFSSIISQKAYKNKLLEYTTQHKTDEISAEADTFRTLMKEVKTAEDLVKFENREALTFIKEAFGLEDSTASNSEIVTYLNTHNEFGLDEEGNNLVPEEWALARKTLSFFDETVLTISPSATDKKPSSDAVIEKVISERFKNELADETGHFDYGKRINSFRASVSDLDTLDKLIAEDDTMLFLKEAYNISGDLPEAETLKSLFKTEGTVYAQIAEDLGFSGTSRFETALSSYTNADDLISDSVTFDIVKTAYGLEEDTTDNETILSYLTAETDTDVPEEWKAARTQLGYYESSSSAPSTESIQEIETLYLSATGKDRVDETPHFSSVSNIITRHTNNTVPIFSDIGKFQAFEKESDFFEISISLVGSDTDFATNSRALRFAMDAYSLENAQTNSSKALKILTGEQALQNTDTDKKWRDFRNDFSFSLAGNTLRTQEEGFADSIVSSLIDNSFIEAVGEQDDTLRLALYFEQRIAELSERDNIDNFGWLAVSGEPPLATVFQTAFNLSSSFGQLDIDKQKEIYELRSNSLVGSPNISAYQDTQTVSDLLETYLLRATSNSSSTQNNLVSLLG